MVINLFLCHVNSVIVACTNSWPGWMITVKIKIKIKVQPAMAQTMAWHRSGDEPLSELMMAEVTDHLSHSASTSSRGIPWWRHQVKIYWPFVRGIHRSPVNSPHKGQWREALIFSLICVWINGWVNNREAGDLIRYRAPLWRHCNAENQVANKETRWQLSIQCISPERGTRITSWKNVPSQ